MCYGRTLIVDVDTSFTRYINQRLPDILPMLDEESVWFNEKYQQIAQIRH